MVQHAVMPRIARGQLGGVCGHVINRGNARQTVFHDEEDYTVFVELIGLACERIPVRVVGCCLMPNHFHLVLWPRADIHEAFMTLGCILICQDFLAGSLC